MLTAKCFLLNAYKFAKLELLYNCQIITANFVVNHIFVKLQPLTGDEKGMTCQYYIFPNQKPQ